MSNKYAVDVLQKRALVHLSSAYPATLTDWEEAESPSWFDDVTCGYIQLEILLLARQTGALWILPAVFYQMCQNSYMLDKEIIDGPLSSRDIVLYIQGARFLESTAKSHILDFLWSPEDIKGCRNSGRGDCMKSRHRLRRVVDGRRRFGPEDGVAMPLEVWEEDDWAELKVCDRCLSMMKNIHMEAKESVWDQLPDWRCLREMRNEALS
jgi:hypothetical protein